MEKYRQFRSFYLLESETNLNINQLTTIPNLILEKAKGKQLQFAPGQKIFIKSSELVNNITEFEFIWEVMKEIKTEELDENGDIFTVIKQVKSVASVSIWFHKGYPFIYLFIKSGVNLRDILSILEMVLETKIRKINFDNDFFQRLTRSDFILDVLQSTHRSHDGGMQLFSISSSKTKGPYYNNANEENQIMEVTVLFDCNIPMKAKVNKTGRIALYNSPDVEDIICILEGLSELLINMGKGGFSRE